MYLRSVALTMAAVLFAYASVEVAVDEFGVFRHAGSATRVCMPNSRVVKLHHLEADRERDAFVLGSSRANAYSAAMLSRLSGHRYYNLSSPMENAVGMERWVRWLSARPGVRQVVLTLDFDLQEHPYNPSDPFIRDPPELTHEVPALFAARYLLTPPDQIVACVRAKLKGSRYSFDPRTGEDIEAGREVMQYAPEKMEAFSEGRTDASTARLAAMVSMLRARGVNVVVIVNPVWLPRFLTFRPQTYEAWLRNVVRATGGVWDFSGVNQVTAHMTNYYDDVHFTNAIGDRVLQTVFGDRRSDGFGAYIDGSSVELRVAQIGRDFALNESRVALGPQPANSGPVVRRLAEATIELRSFAKRSANSSHAARVRAREDYLIERRPARP